MSVVILQSFMSAWRIGDKPNEKAGDIETSIGAFVVSDLGVDVRLRPPLSKLSGTYKWKHVPLGLVAFKTLLTGVGPCEVIDMIPLSDREKDLLDKLIGRVDVVEGDPDVICHDSPYLEDLDKIFTTWCPRLADMCPSAPTAHDLRALPKMCDRDIESYVASRRIR